MNPAPEKVSNPKFRQGEFFDPRGAAQVKYELLRRVLVGNVSVTDAAEEYGISRQTYYQAKASIDQAGIAGLVPKKPGPHGTHKLRGEVMAFIEQRLVPGEPIRRARELAMLIRREFGLDVNPRTIERAVKEKNCPARMTSSSGGCADPNLTRVFPDPAAFSGSGPLRAGHHVHRRRPGDRRDI